MFQAWVLVLMMGLGETERVVPSMRLAAQISAAAEAHPLQGSRERMAAVLVAIAWAESRFAAAAVGDKGASLGAFQIGRGWVRPPEGDAELAARLVGESFRVCAVQPLDARLAWYAHGGAGCSPLGAPASRWRMGLAGRLLRTASP